MVNSLMIRDLLPELIHTLSNGKKEKIYTQEKTIPFLKCKHARIKIICLITNRKYCLYSLQISLAGIFNMRNLLKCTSMSFKK